jgi:ABC-type lipoprotein release transport system permease subunit
MRRIEETGMKFGDLSLMSDPLVINQSFMALTDAFAGCLIPFMIIEVLGVAFILGSLSYSSFMERRKQAAILSALGASENDRSFLYEGEGFLNAFYLFLLDTVCEISTISLMPSLLPAIIGHTNKSLYKFCI